MLTIPRNAHLWRLAAYVASVAQTASVQRRFYQFFQFVRLDGAHSARVVVELLGLSDKPWVLAIDRTNWDFGKTTININILMIREGRVLSRRRPSTPSSMNRCCQRQTQVCDVPVWRMIDRQKPNPPTPTIF